MNYQLLLFTLPIFILVLLITIRELFGERNRNVATVSKILGCTLIVVLLILYLFISLKLLKLF